MEGHGRRIVRQTGRSGRAREPARGPQGRLKAVTRKAAIWPRLTVAFGQNFPDPHPAVIPRALRSSIQAAAKPPTGTSVKTVPVAGGRRVGRAEHRLQQEDRHLGPGDRRPGAVPSCSAAAADPFGRDLLDPVRREEVRRHVGELRSRCGCRDERRPVLALQEEDGHLIAGDRGVRAEFPAAAAGSDAVARDLRDRIVERVGRRHVEEVERTRQRDQDEGVELGSRRLGRRPADRGGGGEAGHGDRNRAAVVGARDHGRAVEILSVADLERGPDVGDSGQIDVDGVLQVPVEDGDVGAAGLVLVGPDEDRQLRSAATSGRCCSGSADFAKPWMAP